jgi:sarcosine oxidase, subunit alpha
VKECPVPETPIKILFEGKTVPCRADATVATALWEHGVKVLSHSPKYGRSRGLLCARGHCMNCLMRVDGVPNVRTCHTAVTDGMRIERQDTGAFYGPSMQKVLNSSGHLMPVGFYYKWFTKPAAVSNLFMKGIRPMTGVGRLPERATWVADESLKARDLGQVETIVIGAGASGMAATLDIQGDVLLVDDHSTAGGQRRAALAHLAASSPDALNGLVDLTQLHEQLETLAFEIEARDNVKLMSGTTLVGAWQPDMLLLQDQEGLILLRAKRIIWAAGAFDALPLFDDNDLPGLIGPRALYRLLTRDNLVVKDRKVVVWGHGPDLWLSASLLHVCGAKVTLALDEEAKADGALLEVAHRLGWALQTNTDVVAAMSQDHTLDRLVLSSGGGRHEIPCEFAVLCCRGKPIYDVPYQLGVDLVLKPERGGFVPRENTGSKTDAVTVVGEAAGRNVLDVLREVTT